MSESIIRCVFWICFIEILLFCQDLASAVMRPSKLQRSCLTRRKVHQHYRTTCWGGGWRAEGCSTKCYRSVKFSSSERWKVLHGPVLTEDTVTGQSSFFNYTICPSYLCSFFLLSFIYLFKVPLFSRSHSNQLLSICNCCFTACGFVCV